MTMKSGGQLIACLKVHYFKNEGLAENLRAAPLCPSQEIAATLGSDVFQQGDRVPCEA